AAHQANPMILDDETPNGDAVVVSVAKALTAHIEAQEFAANAEVQRSYAEWDLDLANAESLQLADPQHTHITIASHTTEQENALSARGKMQFDVPIDIAIRKRLTATEQVAATGRMQLEEQDALMLLVEQVHAACTTKRLPEFDSAVWQSTRIVVAPWRNHLRELRQFTGIVRVTF